MDGQAVSALKGANARLETTTASTSGEHRLLEDRQATRESERYRRYRQKGLLNTVNDR